MFSSFSRFPNGTLNYEQKYFSRVFFFVLSYLFIIHFFFFGDIRVYDGNPFGKYRKVLMFFVSESEKNENN